MRVFAVLALVPVTAEAQVPAARTPDEIVVSASQKPVETPIDRKVYNTGRDLLSATGSASDVLNNLPSVDIDAAGGISIRGDTRIQVLIDGKPSTGTSAGNRAEFLQQIPANTIERVEVITNPSARFKADGATGIVNIILKKNRSAGRSGSVQVVAGSDGRFTTGFAQAYRGGPVNISGRFNLKRDIPYRPFGNTRTQPGADGGPAVSVQDALIRSRRLAQIAVLDVDYDVTPADRISAGIDYQRRTGRPILTQSNRVVDARGRTLADFDRTGFGAERQVTADATAKYRHSFAGKEHELTVDFRRSTTEDDQTRNFTNRSRGGGVISADRQRPRSEEIQHELTIEYSRPLARGAKLLVGYDVQRDDDSFRNSGAIVDIATGAATPDPAFTNRFDFVQTVHAAYATYERPFGAKLTALLGLRAEATSRAISRPPGIDDTPAYVRLFPTLHLDYAIAEGRTLRLSYSRRIVRPEPADLNPFPFFQNPINLRGGNPALRPQTTDSVEAAYEFTALGATIELTPFVRSSTNVFSDFSRLVSPGVLLVAPANIGKTLAAGTDAAASGKIVRGLAYSVSGSVYYSRIDAAALGLADRRAIVTATAKASLDWQASAKDLIQLSTSYAGRRLIAQGTRDAVPSLNLGIRHQVRPALAAVLTVIDVFDTRRDDTVITSGAIRDAARFRLGRRAVTAALTYNFGGTAKPAAAFDYSN